MGEAKRRRALAVEVLPNGIMLGRNRPTEEGRRIGTWLAEMADQGEPLVRLKFPAAPPRCKSCAFVHGTVPNGCPETVIDAFGCIVEGIPFMCHQHFDDDGNPIELCAGWDFACHSKTGQAAREMLDGKMPFDMPAKGVAAQEHLDEERRKLRAKKRAQAAEAEGER